MKASSYFISGCMFIGMGLGFLFNAMPAGFLIGLGTGLLLSALSDMSYSKNIE